MNHYLGSYRALIVLVEVSEQHQCGVGRTRSVSRSFEPAGQASAARTTHTKATTAAKRLAGTIYVNPFLTMSSARKDPKDPRDAEMRGSTHYVRILIRNDFTSHAKFVFRLGFSSAFAVYTAGVQLDRQWLLANGGTSTVSSTTLFPKLRMMVGSVLLLARIRHNEKRISATPDIFVASLRTELERCICISWFLRTEPCL